MTKGSKHTDNNKIRLILLLNRLPLLQHIQILTPRPRRIINLNSLDTIRNLIRLLLTTGFRRPFASLAARY